MQIEREKDNSDIRDDFLYYDISDVDGFFKSCDFLKPFGFCELVLTIGRNLDSITVCGFQFGDISEYEFITDEMEMFVVCEYIYEKETGGRSVPIKNSVRTEYTPPSIITTFLLQL